MSKPKRPTDANQRAKLIVDIATGEVDEKKETKIKGSAGGKKGGIARAKKLTSEERKKIAKNAAEKRWSSKK